jgi:DNA-binding LacI/PurR family transcriptional regulator
LTVSLPDGVHVLVEEFAHHADLIDAATKTAVARGLALVVVPAGDSTIWDRLPLDGTIVVDPVPDDPALGEMRGRSVPIVTVGRLPGGGVDTLVVDNDYEGGTVLMLDHLVEAGAQRIGMIGAGTGESYEADILGAYRRWCAEHDMETWISLADDVDWSSPRAWAELETICRATAASCLDRDDVPDALFCLAESFAVGVLTECAARGLDVPNDVMVSSMADRGLTGRTEPPLTALDLHPRHLGTVAAQTLADLVEGVVIDPDPVTVPVTLVTRESTAREEGIASTAHS